MRKSVIVRLNDNRQAKLEFLQAFYSSTFGRDVSDKEILVAALEMMYEGLLHSDKLQGDTETSASSSSAGSPEELEPA